MRARTALSAVVTALCLTATLGPAPAYAAVPGPAGVDVSGYQHPGGAPIDWAAARAAGEGFAFVKATEGTTYRNPYFASDWSRLGSAGLARGAYHFARPSTSPSSATDQARAFVALVGDTHQTGALAPVLDLETDGGMSPAQLTAWASTWLTTVRQLTGRRPIIYTYPYFWRTAMADTTAFTSYPLFLADYSDRTGTTSPRLPLPGGWTTWAFWQYSDAGTVRGIASPVDLDRAHGSLGQYVWTSAPATPDLTPYTSLVLRTGSTGPAVVAVQQVLRITADGDFGPQTAAAVSAFQTSHGLPGTGVVEAATWAALIRYEHPESSTTVSPIAQKYAALGGAKSVLGGATGAETSAPGSGRMQAFSRGDIYWSAATSAHEVHGAVQDTFARLGRVGTLGYPTTDETQAPDGVGRYNHFTRGSVYWTPTTSAHAVMGGIRDRWTALRREQGPGYPITDELGTADGVGRYSIFTHGSIYWTPTTGAHEVKGAIRDRWAAAGAERSAVGYPATDELALPDGAGRLNRFAHGAAYWHSGLGAHLVYGAVLSAYGRYGWERGRLGYPVGDEVSVKGGRQQAFQHGSLFWNATNGTVTLR